MSQMREWKCKLIVVKLANWGAERFNSKWENKLIKAEKKKIECVPIPLRVAQDCKRNAENIAQVSSKFH